MRVTIPQSLLKEIVHTLDRHKTEWGFIWREGIFSYSFQIEWQIFTTYMLRMVAQIPDSNRSEDIDEFILVIRVVTSITENVSQRYYRLLETCMILKCISFSWALIGLQWSFLFFHLKK